MGGLSRGYRKRDRGIALDIVLLVIGSAIMTVTAAAAVHFGMASTTCWARWHITTYEYRTTLLGQCMVKHPTAGWVPDDKIRFGPEN